MDRHRARPEAPFGDRVPAALRTALLALGAVAAACSSPAASPAASGSSSPLAAATATPSVAAPATATPGGTSGTSTTICVGPFWSVCQAESGRLDGQMAAPSFGSSPGVGLERRPRNRGSLPPQATQRQMDVLPAYVLAQEVEREEATVRNGRGLAVGEVGRLRRRSPSSGQQTYPEDCLWSRQRTRTTSCSRSAEAATPGGARPMPSRRANGSELRQLAVVTPGGMLWLARKTLSGS
jgi:hypothetical protein